MSTQNFNNCTFNNCQIILKHCNTCSKDKSTTEFQKDKNKKDGLKTVCKECRKLETKKYNENNKEKIKQKQKNYRETHKDEISAQQKKFREAHQKEIKEQKKNYYESHKEEIKQKQKKYYETHKDEISVYQKSYRETHQEQIKEYRENYKPRRNELNKEQRKNDYNYKIKNNLRSRLRSALNGTSKSAKTMDLLGCDIECFKGWLEFNFYDNMDWGNYGSYWHIDHVRPCASFDLTDSEQQKKCFHWTNTQPLRADENLSKNDKRDTNAELMQEHKVKFFLLKKDGKF